MKRNLCMLLSIVAVSAFCMASCDNGSGAKNGKTSLVNVTEEVAGANCASGGKKIESGIDANNDGLLQAEEVTTISYVCADSSGGAVMVKESDGTEIGYLSYSTTYDRQISVITTKGYLVDIDTNSGQIEVLAGEDDCSYKKGGSVVTDCYMFDESYHNISDCSDDDLIENGIPYVLYENINSVWNYQNALYTVDITSGAAPAYRKSGLGGCYANSTFLYKIKATTTSESGVKLSYKTPLLYFVSGTELH